ncbi:Histone-lysine N-methyltransferase SETMAR [Eumeta japonica]|uniref:Histone-lysine N-methyltransferase SETMAR n=1 Tax=Eumeta variegata TaxID=151549 RepID=A0A4C1SBF9_EUMVA|nr:Histone-lysine N-methyltransferase SETMAR [Eumeta japonica]
MVKKWFTEVRCGRTSTSDAERSGRPKEVTPEIVDKIHEMVLDDQRMKVRELAHAVAVIRTNFGPFCYCGRNMDPSQHARDQATIETGFGVNVDQRRPNRVCQPTRSWPQFWDARGVIHIDYLEKGKTITGEYYSKLLDRFDVDLKQNGRIWRRRKCCSIKTMHVHTCLVTMAKIHELRYELLPHPAYSPDLVPCDYYLFPNPEMAGW